MADVKAPKAGPPRTVSPAAQPVADLAERLAAHLGSIEAAVEFMRSFPGCRVEIPPADVIEGYAATFRAAPSSIRP